MTRPLVSLALALGLLLLAGSAMSVSARPAAADRDDPSGDVAEQSAGQADEKPHEKEVRKPSLHLRVTPAVVFSPARVRVDAELRGGSDDSPELYCPGVEWDWGDGTRSEARTDCEPFEPGKSEIQRRFTASHQYNMPGRYEVRLRLKRGNKVILAGQVNVQVRPGARDFGNPF
ncbi:MAG TPA: hypothetical protein VIL25_03155 [Vicinamibacterales bacterium]